MSDMITKNIKHPKNQTDKSVPFDAFVTPTLNTFYNDDCMNWLPKCPPNFFELAIVDPPYGYEKNTTRRETKPNKGNAFAIKYHGKNWNTSPPSIEYFDELMRVSKNQIVCGGNYFTDKLPVSRGWIFWDKKGDGLSVVNNELIWTSFDQQIKKFTRCHGLDKGFMNPEGENIHPTQKPVALYKWMLREHAKAGDKILDTHAGSASCLVACKEMGFDYVGFEIDKEYWTIANERLGRACYQPELFGRSG